MFAPESSLTLPLTPEERLGHIQDFLFTTHSIRMSRVFWAEMLAPLVDDETVSLTREDILKNTDENITKANEALRELQNDSQKQLWVQHPRTGELGTLNLLGITPDKITYMGKVMFGGKLDIWDIGAIPTLSLK